MREATLVGVWVPEKGITFWSLADLLKGQVSGVTATMGQPDIEPSGKALLSFSLPVSQVWAPRAVLDIAEAVMARHGLSGLSTVRLVSPDDGETLAFRVYQGAEGPHPDVFMTPMDTAAHQLHEWYTALRKAGFDWRTACFILVNGNRE